MQMKVPYFTVHQLNEYVRALLSRDPLLSGVQVRGELSNYKAHSSGHRYFTLKDEQDRIRCVFFKGSSGDLAFDPRDGMRVLVRGRVSLYGRDGQYQLYVDTMERDGMGDLHLAFEALKEKLKNEGLFDKDMKKPLPKYPCRIALITSHTGAAVRDIVKVIKRRNPTIDILVVPVLVQGQEAARQIARALDYVNTLSDIDLIITGRGGGSIEELWAFNEEEVARALFRSRIPVICAVGHETDFTIADFVADVRAATPSVAGEVAVPEAIHLKGEVDRLRRDLRVCLENRFKEKQRRLDRLAQHYVFKTPQWLIQQHSQTSDQLLQRLQASYKVILATKREALSNKASALHALSPLNVLGRGYAVPLSMETGHSIRSIQDLKPSQRIRILFKDGQALCRVEDTRPDHLNEIDLKKIEGESNE